MEDSREAAFDPYYAYSRGLFSLQEARMYSADAAFMLGGGRKRYSLAKRLQIKVNKKDAAAREAGEEEKEEEEDADADQEAENAHAYDLSVDNGVEDWDGAVNSQEDSDAEASPAPTKKKAAAKKKKAAAFQKAVAKAKFAPCWYHSVSKARLLSPAFTNIKRATKQGAGAALYKEAVKIHCAAYAEVGFKAPAHFKCN